MKKMIAILVAVMLVMAVTPIAFASTEVVKGDGKLFAKGKGRAMIEGTATIEIAGAGNLVITDSSSTATIKFHGKVKAMKKDGNKTIYRGFVGRIHIEGEQVKVQFEGKARALHASGEGKAVFHGKWKIRSHGKDVPMNKPDVEVPVTQ